MGLREVAGDMARTTSGMWRGIAEVVDPHAAERHAPRPAAAPEPEPEPAPVQVAAAAVEEIDLDAGTMLVPIDSWTRVLDQLGNLHEAGQQLAEARERAAKAETENVFLREQLRDLKAATAKPRARRPAEPAPRADAAPPTTPPTAVPEPRSIRARRQVSKWLSP